MALQQRRQRESEGGFPIWKVLTAGSLGGAALVVGVYLFSGDVEYVDAEARFDGVHLCAPEQQDEAAQGGTAIASLGPFATPTPAPALGITPTPEGTTPAEGTPGATATAGAPATAQPDAAASPPAGTPTPRPAVPTRPGPATGSSPFFAQVDPSWGGKEYDHGFRQDVGCGSTIAQCGCAMTSVATLLSLFQLMTTPDGQPLNPDTLNAWFNQGATLTKDGWVSQGYVYGNVVWTSVASFSASAARQDPGAARLRYSRWGSGSEQEIRSELQAGRPVILEVPGHYIAAVALDGNDIIINDPAYRDRVTLDAYKGKVVSSRLFEASNDQGAIVVTVPANLRVRVTDSEGRVVGILGSDSVSSAQDKAKQDIPGSQYRFESAWRDPTCTERPPPPEAGVNTILIPSPAEGSYKVEVENPDGGSTSVSVHSYDENGNSKLDTHESDGDTEVDIDYDPDQGATVTPGAGGGATTGPRFVDVTESRFPKLAASSLDAAMIDVDRDGDLDMVIGNGRFVFQDTPPASRDAGSRPPTPEQNLVLINDGEGVFALPEVNRLPPGPSTTLALVAADFDGDGDIDLFIGDDGAQKLLLNNGLGVFAPGGAIPGAGSPIKAAQAADVNGDRLPDLLIAPGNREGTTPRLLINAGGGSFREAGLPGVKGKAVNHLAPGDVDGDGDLDLFVALGGSNKPLLWLNDGAGGFVDASNRLPGAKLDAQKAALADLDGDGDADIMVAALKGGSRLYVNDGEGKFSDLTGARMPKDLQAVDIQLADFDRDGDMDSLLVGSLILLANDGRAFFSDVSGLLPPVPGNTRAARWGDVDGDGDLDLTVMRFNSKYNVLLMNTVDDTPVVTTSPTPTPTPEPSATAGATATLQPGVTPTITPTLAPATVSVRVDSNKVIFAIGENVPVCYTVNRPQEIVLDLVSPRGDRTNLITGRDDGTGDCFPIDMSNRRTSGPWRVELTGENNASDFSTFNVAPPLNIIAFGPGVLTEVAPCGIVIPYQAQGDTTLKIELLLNQVVVNTSTAPQGEFQATYAPGILNFQLRVSDTSGQRLSAVLTYQPICIRYLTATYVSSCSTGVYNKERWLVDGGPSATWRLQRRFKANAAAAYGPYVDITAAAAAVYGTEQVYDDQPHNMAAQDVRFYQYRLVVTVGGRVVMLASNEVQYKVVTCIF